MPTALSPHTYLMIRKLESNFTLTAEERQALQELPVQTQDVKSNQDIVKMGDQPSQCCLLLEGFSCVYKLTLEGKRQIMALHIPGDMPDLQSLHLQVIDINIASLSTCKLLISTLLHLAPASSVTYSTKTYRFYLNATLASLRPSGMRHWWMLLFSENGY
ncbi:hypothetical protein NYA30BAC_01218 [Halomonas sp. NYA30]|tara:strand:- start:60 stop:539 length:480 start_codon:yes stop_codon:yes gene_type:complete